MPDRIIVSPEFCDEQLCAVYILQIVDGEGQTRLETVEHRLRTSFGLPSSIEERKRIWFWDSGESVVVVLHRRDGHDVLGVGYLTRAGAAKMRANSNPLAR
jgi:hypothetical protein